MDVRDAGEANQRIGLAVHRRDRPASPIVQYLNVVPTESFGPAGAKRFENGFLGCKTAGERGVWRGALEACSAFGVGVDAVQEPVLPAFGQGLDPATNRAPSEKTSETIPTNRRIRFRRRLNKTGCGITAYCFGWVAATQCNIAAGTKCRRPSF